MQTITFKSGRKEYTVSENYKFMDNGSCIQYMSKSHSFSSSVLVPKKEWQRIKPLLNLTEDYTDNFTGTSVKIYSI